MPNTKVDIYINGLRNAHALENEAISIMSRQVERLGNYPDVERRLKQHIGETETQQERLKEILMQFDEDSSTMKDLGGKFMGSLASLGHAMAGDEILKNTFANYAFENYEIASYKSLITIADVLGHTAHAKLLEQTLGEEIAMAGWIEENVGDVTLKYLDLTEAGARAKV